MMPQSIKDLLEQRARAMAAHDADNYGPLYIVGAVSAIIADLMSARDDLLAGAPAAGSAVAPDESPITEQPSAEPATDLPSVDQSPAAPQASEDPSEPEPAATAEEAG